MIRPVSTPRPIVELSQREQKEYSVTRAILAVADGENSFEREVGDTLRVELARSLNLSKVGIALGLDRLPNSVLIPTGMMARAVLDSQTSTKGAELKFVEPGPFLELLRAKAMVGRLGATVLGGLRGDVDAVRQTGSATAQWLPESPTADVTISNLTLDRVSLRPKTLMATMSTSRKLAEQSRPAADELVARDFVRAFAVELDKKSIQGTGTNNEPTGILNTAGIGSVAGGANGAAPTYDHAVDLEFSVADANGDDTEGDGVTDTLGYLATPKIRQRLRKSAAIIGGNLPAWGRNELAGRRAEVSKQMPETLTKGTSSAICHALIFARWSELLIGEWGAVDIIVDPFTLQKRADIELTAFWLADVALGHAAAFSAMKDALP
jgi:HK97 family phage major capsid protein